jgi:hypothetical protein
MPVAALEAFHDKLIDGLEFCRMVYSRFEEVASQPHGSQVLRNLQRPEKKLLEELFPISRYIQTFYGPGQYISVRWVDGGQSFDAKVVTTGAMVDHGAWPSEGTLEVTQAVHENDHLMRELLNTEGGGFGLDGLKLIKGKGGVRAVESEPTCYSNQSYIDSMCTIVLNAIAPKIAKLEKGDYPADTTLIVNCTLMTVFLPSEWEKLVDMVRGKLPSNGFVRIFATANSGGYFATL